MTAELTAERPPSATNQGTAGADHAPAGNSLRRNLRSLAGGQLVTWIMTLLWTLVVPRVIGPPSMGAITAAIAVSSVLAILLGLGTRQFLVREIVIHREKGPKLVGTTIVMRLALAPLVVIAAVAFAHFAHYGHETRIALYLASVITILTLLAEPMQAALQAVERMQYLAYADIINKSAQSVIGVVLVLIGFRAVGILADMAVAAAVVILLTYHWLRPSMHIDLRTNRQVFRELMRGSATYWAAGMFSMFYLWVDSAMLSVMTRSTVVGWYGVTTNLFQTCLFVPVLITTAWLPRLVQEFSHSHERLMKAARAPLELVAVTSLPIATLITIFAPLGVRILYGHAYGHAVPVLIILAWCLPWMYLTIVLYMVFTAMQRASVWTFLMIGAAIFNPALNFFLIRLTQSQLHNGALGAAASMVLTELIMTIAVFVMLKGEILDRHLITRWLWALTASAVAIGVTYATIGLSRTAAPFLGAAVLISLLVKLDVIQEAERAQVRSLLLNVRGRLSRRPRSGGIDSGQ